MNRVESKGEKIGKLSILRRYTKDIQFPSRYTPAVENIKLSSQSYQEGVIRRPASGNRTRLTPAKHLESNQTPSKSVNRIRSPYEKKKKLWRVTELELSNSHLTKELQRTQRVLEIALTKISNGETSVDVAGELLKQQVYLKFLQKENEKFHLIFDNSSHLDHDKLIISRLADKVISLQEENLRLNAETAKQARSSFFLTTKSKKVNRRNIIGNIYRACCLHRLDIDELGYILNPNTLNEIPISVIQKGLNAIDVVLSEQEIQNLISSIVGYEIQYIPQGKLIQGIKALNEGFAEYSDILPLVNKLKLAFAALWTNKNDLIEHFPENKFTCEEFVAKIIKDGLNVPAEVLRRSCKIVFGDAQELESRKIITGIFGMFDEIIITSEQEEKFDETSGQ